MADAPTLLENYVIKLDSRLTGLEENVQKLTTIINKIVNDHAVFDFKQEQNVRVSAKLEEMVDKAREKLEANGSDFIRELNQRETKLNNALDAYKAEVIRAREKLKEDVDSDIESLQADVDKLTDRVDDLRRWIWLATGGGAVALFIFEIMIRILNLG